MDDKADPVVPGLGRPHLRCLHEGDELRRVAGRVAAAPPGLPPSTAGTSSGATATFAATAGAAGPAASPEAASPGVAGAAATAKASALVMQAGIRHREWAFGTLPEIMELARGRDTLIGYPALVDVGDAVELQVFDSPDEARVTHRRGLNRLFAIVLREPLRFFERNLPEARRLELAYAPFGGADELRRELIGVLIDRACLTEPLPFQTLPSSAGRSSTTSTRVCLLNRSRFSS